ncbi:MAG: hypothetical protein KY453_10240, partial [Gemmatimonadetes bacterium]|nr:hypothetical protein [Gemmatimonadota bacterium]
MSDHDMDEPPLMGRLGELAEDYHRPPPVPREAMWAAIGLPVAVALAVLDYRRWRSVTVVALAGSLAALVLVETVNMLPTRFWCAILLLAAGQITLLVASTTAGFEALGGVGPLLGLALCITSLAAAWLAPSPQAQAPLNRLWLDFRDLFGVLWGLRVAERFNAASSQYGWPVVLTWRGFQT